MKTHEKIFLFAILAIIGLHIWGALAPAHMNWGVHFFALYPPFVGIISFGIIALLIIPFSQGRIIALKESVLRSISKIPIPFLIVASSGAVMILGNIFSSKLHLLGDGILLLRSLSNTEWGSNIMQSFNNQPLMYWLFRSALNFHLIDSPASTYDLYVWLDRLSALGMMALIFWWLRPLKLTLFTRVLLGALFFFGAGCQFFFGYIENYVLQYLFTGLFVISGWLALERRAPIALPVLSVIVMCGLHLGNLVFLPALLVLLLVYHPKAQVRTLLVSGVLSVAGFALIYALGYLPTLLRHFTPESVDFLHPFSTPTGNFGYAMFSSYHFLDWLNLNLLAAPFGLLIAVGILAGSARTIDWKKPALLFLLVAASCGLIFTWIINSALGMARDWDLLVGFFVPLMILDVYLLSTSEFMTRSRGLLVVVVACTLIHTAAFIGVNADEERHIARLRLLGDARFLSPTTLLFYDEALANFFFDTGRYAEAKIYYEHSMRIDPNNPRIVGNISDVYRKLGESENYFKMLLRAVEIKSVDPGIYSNLGVEYAGRGDTNRAIEFNERAVALDPRQEKAHANLGLLYVSKKNFPVAREHFVKAMELGMNDPIIVKYAAELSFYLSDFSSSVKYYDVYLRMKPGDQGARVLRARALEALKK